MSSIPYCIIGQVRRSAGLISYPSSGACGSFNMTAGLTGWLHPCLDIEHIHSIAQYLQAQHAAAGVHTEIRAVDLSASDTWRLLLHIPVWFCGLPCQSTSGAGGGAARSWRGRGSSGGLHRDLQSSVFSPPGGS